MTTLTTTQETVLKAAAAREDGSIHPMPTNLKGGVAKKVIAALAAKNLIDENGVITTLGLDAIHPENATPKSTTDDAPTTTESTLALETAKAILDQAEKDVEGYGDHQSTLDEAAAAQVYAEANAAYETAAKAYLDAEDALNKAIRKGKSVAIVDKAREEMIAAGEAANQTAEAAMIAQDILDTFAPQKTTAPVTTDATPATTVETDVAAAEQALAEKHIQAAMEANELALLETIARRHLGFETLETRMSDSLDFHDVSVWCIRNALTAAYEAGLQAAKKPATKRTLKASADKAPRDNKKSMVLAMLARPNGATIEQIADATNWQTHTIRSFLSIAKKKGTNIAMVGTNTDGSRIYHIAA